MRTIRSGWAALPLAICLAVPVAAQEETTSEPDEVETSQDADYDRPLFLDFDAVSLDLWLSMAGRVEDVSSFPVDAEGNLFEMTPAFNVQLRAGAAFTTKTSLRPWRLSATYEQDLITGLYAGGYSGNSLGNDDFGLDLPDSGDAEIQLRKAMGQVDYGTSFHLMGGRTASHWGMGLLANNGARGFTPGSALFIDPRGGDLVLRSLIAVGPVTDVDLMVAAAYDAVRDDDVLRSGDEAYQGIATVVFGYLQPTWIGAYFVARRQTASDGAWLDVQAVDVAGAYRRSLGDWAAFTLEAEGVYVWGRTTLSPTTEFPQHDVRQFGAAVRTGLDFGQFGTVWDFLFASGDNNPDDDRLTAFKTDVNFPTGLLLFRYVVAAQTARAPMTASDPEFVGVPAPDLERLPTQGAATNTISFYPRLWWRPVQCLELYGGPLFAWSQVDVVDPFNTRLAGGEPRNALNGVPGSYLGTELDFGLRYTKRFAWMEVRAAGEAGVLFPGSAFNQPNGESMDTVTGGRFILELHF